MDISDFDSLVDGDLSCIWDFKSHDDFHEGRFPGTIDAD